MMRVSMIGYLRRRLHSQRSEQRATTGDVLHSAFWYDVIAAVLTGGKERVFREKTVETARLRSGESVLDVGCGTGTLAIAAKGHVGPQGKVCAIDPSPEMIARARKKARRAGLDIRFENGVVESLPFPNASFDVVLSSIMLHHLPDDVRRAGLREMRRVLKPGGRLLIVDFGGGAHGMHRWARHGRRHRDFDLRTVVPEVTETGLQNVENGALGFRDLQFIRAAAP